MRSAAAVIVVPGIMGCELKDGNRTVWGFRAFKWYFDIWKANQFSDLKLTPAEREGQYGRIRATGPIASAAFLPKLGKINPYRELLNHLRARAIHEHAVSCFAYDWRLPVAHNGRILARYVEERANLWRQHPAFREHQSDYPDERMRIVVVAHSMGGLVAKHAASHTKIDRIIALGTPWIGSVLSLAAMSAGKISGLPFSEESVRDLARNLPSMHDLLPRWACIDPNLASNEPEVLTSSTVASLGGDAELADAAQNAFEQRTDSEGASVYSLAGVAQPTPTSVQITATGVNFSPLSFKKKGNAFVRDRLGNLVRVDRQGDGTVPSFSASRPGHVVRSVQCLQHGQLAYASEGFKVAASLVETDEDVDFLHGQSTLGIQLPNLVRRGSSARVEVVGIESPFGITVEVTDLYDHLTDRLELSPNSRGFEARLPTYHEGIFTVIVDDGHGTALQQTYMCIAE